MKIKTFPYDDFAIENSQATLEEAALELFERELITMEGFAMSMRHEQGVHYCDTADLPRMLWGGADGDARAQAEREALRGLHTMIYDTVEEIAAVIIARPPVAALHLDGDIPFGHSTSMLRKRGIDDVNACVYPPDAADPDRFADTLATARDIAQQRGMAHLLMLVRQGPMIVCGQNLHEAMAHSQNIEYCARMEHAGALYRSGW